MATFNWNEMVGNGTATFSNGAFVAIIYTHIDSSITFSYAKKTSNKPYTVHKDWSKYKIAKFLLDNKFQKN